MLKSVTGTINTSLDANKIEESCSLNIGRKKATPGLGFPPEQRKKRSCIHFKGVEGRAKLRRNSKHIKCDSSNYEITTCFSHD